jgi:hypothetical protein
MNAGVPSDVGEVLAAMTHGSATVPDPLQRHDVGACKLPLPRELEPVAFAMRQWEQREPPETRAGRPPLPDSWGQAITTLRRDRFDARPPRPRPGRNCALG